VHITVKPPFEVSLGTSGFEHGTEEYIIWRKFMTAFESGSLELSAK
jgi:hypothetical protein